MEAIILLGGPGAGKGTLAGRLVQQTGFLHVSTGDMLRAALKEGTPRALQFKARVEAGGLVPDEIILEMIAERVVAEPIGTRFMFDGFPRTIEQAEGLEAFFAAKAGTVSHVLNLMVPRSMLLQRLTGRRVCRTCSAVYHLLNRPPRVSGLCDVDGGELYQRADDSEAVILNRLAVYETQTAPLIAFYRRRGMLRDIDAGGTPEATVGRVMAVLNGQERG